MAPSADHNVVVICGGLGTRLRSLFPNQQKTILEVAGKPFLQWIITFYRHYGLGNFIFCVGHRADQVEATVDPILPHELYRISKEVEALGTAGAVRNALDLISSEDVIVANGDSFCDVDLSEFIRFHFSHEDSQISMAVTDPDPSRQDMGQVVVDPMTARVQGFTEKGEHIVRGFRNAGIYIMKRSVLSRLPPDQTISFEHEVFPAMVGQGFYAFKTGEKVWDIGTPERYHDAQAFFQARHSSLSSAL